MKQRYLPALLFVLVLLSSCGSFRKELDRRLSLWRKDDIPYGTRVAYESLPRLFPDADVSINGSNPAALSAREGKKAYIIIVPFMDPQPADVTALTNFVGEGNQVFISANRISKSLLHSLGIRTSTGPVLFFGEPDSLTLGIYHPLNQGYRLYTYPGDSYDNYVISLDSQYTSILGRDGRGRPDFVRIGYKGGGAIFLHFAPLAFSNFFLLHKQNIAYYESALSYLPASVKEVIWDDYFRYDHGKPFSAFQFLLSGPPGTAGLRWAFWLLLLLFALIYIFDSKRRQRMVPLIPPLRNTSLEFVQTIGRLYYQRRDNQNLAAKMTAHFQDYARTRWHLADTTFDEGFENRLANRSGYPKETLADVVGFMRQLPARAYVTDEELLDFHRQLEAFYKHT
jgi:hypothetical protein